MRRRDFIIGGAAMAWPSAGHAQRPAAMPVIGYLGAETPTAFASRIRAFRQGLEQAGYVEGRNVAFDFRWAESKHSGLVELAADLVARKVDLIAALGGAPAALAAKSTNTSIPIVFEMGADPVALGLVASLNKPGGNITGVASLNVELSPKRLEIMHDMVPSATEIAVLVNPTSPTTPQQWKGLQEAAVTLGVRLHQLQARTLDDFPLVLDTLLKSRLRALVVASDTFLGTHGEQLAALARHCALTAIHQSRDFTMAGGLMSYGGNFIESHRLAGLYAGRILKGERPSELPVQQVTKVELAINAKTAKALGLSFPMALLGRADEVVD